jgi:phthalate 4,5-dioxygenase oxygenase subunit
MANRTVRAWVPMDDDHVIWFIMAAPPLVPDDVNELREGVYFAGGELRIREALAPRSTDWFGRFRPIPDAGNDYLVKRDDWREGKSFTGLPSVSMEDHAVTESMGTIYNRSREHLGTSDAMIIRTRHRLIAAAEAFAKEGIIPPGVDEPEVYRQRSGALLLNKDRSNDWFEATKDQRAAFVYHPTEDIYASYVRD